MAIDSYKLKNGQTRYRVAVYLNGERIAQKRGFKTKKEAKDYEAYVRVQGKKKKTMTYQNVENQFLDAYKNSVAGNTFYETKRTLIKHVPDSWKNRKIEDIKPDDAQKFINNIAHLVNCPEAIFDKVSYVFDYAVSLEYIDKNPFNATLKPTKPEDYKPNSSWVIWTPEQVAIFLQACKEDPRPHVYPFFRLAYVTGMRRGELLGCEWSYFSYAERILHVSPTLKIGAEGKAIIGTPKNRSFRDIALDQETADVIEALRPFSTTERIFPFGAKTPSNWMRQIEKRTGLPHSKLHNFRHIHSTDMLNVGVPLQDIIDRLGHKSIQTTLKHYAEVNADKSAIVDMLERNHSIIHYTDDERTNK